MKPRGFLIVTAAIYQAINGLLSLLGALFQLAIDPVMAVVCLVVGILYLASAYGVWTFTVWGRWLTIVLLGLMVASVAAGFVVLVAIGSVAREVLRANGAIWTTLLWTIPAVIVLVKLSSSSARKQFQAT